MDRLWTNVTTRRSYVTGGVGSEHDHEGFTEDYDLPNDTAYAETCAAVGSVLWNHRLFELTGDAAHADVIERTLYNGFLAGVSRSGDEFFYVNPLEATGDHRRREWFYVACCPPNAARLLASLERYLYARSTAGDALYVTQFVGSRVDTTLDGRRVAFEQSTGAPWTGDVALEFTHDDPVAFDLRVRIPAWADDVDAAVNGEPVDAARSDGYLRVERAWRGGDRLEVSVPLAVEALVAHPRVRENAGRVALRRGPLVYCLEDADHDVPVSRIAVPDRGTFAAEHDPDLLGGVSVLRGQGVADAAGSWSDALYRPAGSVERRPVDVVAVPYFAWGDRDPGAMTVWLPST
jgi:hypothetical protein